MFRALHSSCRRLVTGAGIGGPIPQNPCLDFPGPPLDVPHDYSNSGGAGARGQTAETGSDGADGHERVDGQLGGRKPSKYVELSSDRPNQLPAVAQACPPVPDGGAGAEGGDEEGAGPSSWIEVSQSM